MLSSPKMGDQPYYIVKRGVGGKEEGLWYDLFIIWPPTAAPRRNVHDAVGADETLLEPTGEFEERKGLVAEVWRPVHESHPGKLVPGCQHCRVEAARLMPSPENIALAPPTQEDTERWGSDDE